MNIEIVHFCATDNLELSGILYKSKIPTKKVVISLHGMSSNCMKKRDEILASEINKNDIDYFIFNNRGSDLAKYFNKKVDNKVKKVLGGTSYEDIRESVYDIEGSINELVNRGYDEIYLQGHSLGCTKIVYAYNYFKSNNYKLLNKIKAILLLSLVDIKFVEKANAFLPLAHNLEKEGKVHELMPSESFIHPISVKTYLSYAQNYEDIDFAEYGNSKFEYTKLNNISVPLFMRWGNINELVFQDLNKIIKTLSEKINNLNLDIDYIDGANHSYNNCEIILAEQILKFLSKV